MKRYMIAAAIIACFLLNGCSVHQKKVEKNLYAVESFSLSEYDSTEMTLEVDSHDSLTFYVEPEAVNEADIEIYNENENIAKVLLQDIRNVAGNRLIMISVRGMEPGETNVKIVGLKNDLESETVHIKIVEKQESVDISRKVYVNLNGNKYHANNICAGKSAYLTTETEALKSGREPCSKCFN